MRFYLFDRITEFVPGRRAGGIKNISAQEEFLRHHYDRQPVMPAPLIVESIAQLGGWAITVSSGYSCLAVMVMIKGLRVAGDAHPGDQLILDVTLNAINEYGAGISGHAHVDGRHIVSIDTLTYVLHGLSGSEQEEVRTRYRALAGSLTIPGEPSGV
jgi:3-hydroxyacyl-[acyl-carrier-protein] dehydratase